MRITTLVENQAILPVLGAEHGLSLMIETGRKPILFDMGKSDLFLRNAEALGCSIASVDLAIVSHGHYDHGGGMGTFLSANDHAPVYIRSSAFQPHRSNRPNGELADIGLNPALLESGRLVFTGEQEVLDEELSLFSGVVERAHFSDGNASILMLKDGKIVPDDFVHEQKLDSSAWEHQCIDCRVCAQRHCEYSQPRKEHSWAHAGCGDWRISSAKPDDKAKRAGSTHSRHRRNLTRFGSDVLYRALHGR